MKDLRGKVAVITGGASGIGQRLAVNLAAEGCHLVLADMNSKGLEETTKIIENQGDGIKVSCHILDVADRAAVYKFAETVIRERSGIDLVINNAGVTVMETIEDTKYENFEWLFGINFWGAIYMTKAFLPHLLKRPQAHIVNLSSINGIIPAPRHGAYNASKYGLRGFTETLLQEMNGTNVMVSCVHPGAIATDVVKHAVESGKIYKPFGKPGTTGDDIAKRWKESLTSADKAALIIIKGIKKNKARILVGNDAVFMERFSRISPIRAIEYVRAVIDRA